ncbi:MAG: ARMT1-like domain-containing protein [Clostridia bacterium]|nr:ARMT1-like domain-containing protein [Clostridia bacterium]
MLLDEECKGCLYNSQLKKVRRECGGGEKYDAFEKGVRALCQNPPADYCAPLLMRDINRLHAKIFGDVIDYSAERRLFNQKLLAMEDELYAEITAAADPVREAMKYAMAANYIDFARVSDLDEGAVDLVISAAARANPDSGVLGSLKSKLKSAKTLCFLHDNCGEIVLDKLLIRVIKQVYPQIEVISVVRGSPVINDVTEEDAEEVRLGDYARIVSNGTDIPGTYLKEVTPEVLSLIKYSDAVISKGLGNLETLYGEGYDIYYSFTCKCAHIAERFSSVLTSTVLTKEGE